MNHFGPTAETARRDISIHVELEKEGPDLLLEQTTILTIEGEMAFWIRWDSIIWGTIQFHSTVLKNIDGGNIGDDEREVVSLKVRK